MKILIPMAGEGSRFREAGFTFPKPLIDVNGEPMIKVVVDNFKGLDVEEFIFLVRKDHIEKYSYLPDYLNTITSGKSSVIVIDSLTEGAACTALAARSAVGKSDLLVVNSDQFIEFNIRNFDILNEFARPDCIVFTFTSTHPKWSFARLDHSGCIIEIAEKRPISDVATCGAYYFAKGDEFFKAIDKMIEANSRVNGEFYIAPSINFLKGLKLPFFVNKMHGLGTPEDLKKFLGA